MAVTAFAAAKVNLYLHVTGRRADGYHRLDSLVAFPDIGDKLTAEPAAGLLLGIGGPHAASLSGELRDNLVLRAARLLADHTGTVRGAALHLEKNLPVSAGIGGGSSDAAAALRALVALWGLSVGGQALSDLGLRLGADLPACLHAGPAWVRGIGEWVEPARVCRKAVYCWLTPEKSCRPLWCLPPGPVRSASLGALRQCPEMPWGWHGRWTCAATT
jgi:4-diphosphocytidyl-2-C-methyl-D-erythritol kinase